LKLPITYPMWKRGSASRLVQWTKVAVGEYLHSCVSNERLR